MDVIQKRINLARNRNFQSFPKFIVIFLYNALYTSDCNIIRLTSNTYLCNWLGYRVSHKAIINPVKVCVQLTTGKIERLAFGQGVSPLMYKESTIYIVTNFCINNII